MSRDPKQRAAAAAPRLRPLPNWTLWLGLPVAAGAFVWCATRFWFYTIDDAFISYRYALHWAQGYGPVFNIGERVEGYTNFLWVALLAGWSRIGGDPVPGSKILGLMAGAGTVVFLFALGRLIRPRSLFSALAPLLTALHWVFAVNAVSGLETPLLALCTVGALWAFVREEQRSLDPVGSTLFALGAAFARPDGLLVFLVLATLRTVSLARRATPKERRSRAIACAIFFVAILAVYHSWRVWYYGSLRPATLIAKGGGTWLHLTRGWSELVFFLSLTGSWALLSSLLPFLSKPAWPWLRPTFLLILTRFAFDIWSGGPWMGEFRFLATVLPLIFLVVQEGLALAWSARRSRAPAWVTPRLLLVIGCPLWIVWQAQVVSWGVAEPAFVVYAQGLSQAHIRLGRWLGRHAPRSAVLSCQDAGALPYYSGLTTIDQLGLNDLHIASIPRPFYQKVDVDYLLGRHPDYLVLLSKTPGDQSFVGREEIDRALYAEPNFRRGYEVWRVYRVRPGYHLWVFRPLQSSARDERG